MIVAGTGHRPEKLRIGPLDGYHPAVLRRLVDLAALELAIPFDAYVPFVGQESRWPPDSRGRYRELLRRASRGLVVSAGGYSAEKMQARNIRMVDDSELLLALWNGTPGGTRNCVAYAESVGPPVQERVAELGASRRNARRGRRVRGAPYARDPRHA